MNFRDRIERTRENQGKVATANDNEQEESFNSDYFGIENLRNSLACLDLRLADGNRKALPYSYIMEINFDASEGIEIISSGKQVKITGRDLGRLYDYLIVYRVRYIQENAGTDVNETGLFIKAIEINEK